MNLVFSTDLDIPACGLHLIGFFRDCCTKISYKIEFDMVKPHKYFKIPPINHKCKSQNPPIHPICSITTSIPTLNLHSTKFIHPFYFLRYH